MTRARRGVFPPPRRASKLFPRILGGVASSPSATARSAVSQHRGMDAPSPSAPWWGTAAAATQCEGAAPRSDWAGWEAEGWAPASRDGNGFRTRYADDLALLGEHGITHHRLTVEWARLEPYPDRWDVDEVAHLRRV